MPSENPAVTPSWRPRIERGLLWLMLAVTLILPALLGFATTYILIVAIALAALLLLATRGVDWTPEPIARLCLGALAVLAVVFAVTADEPADILSVVNFIAFAACWPLTVLLRRNAATGNAERIAMLALAGAAAGFLLSVVQVYLMNIPRAGVGITDPIRLGDTAVILGFLAPVLAIRGAPHARRWLMLLGPVLALGTVLLSGARISMVALPIVGLVASALTIRHPPMGRPLAGIVVAATLVLAVSFFFPGTREVSLVSGVAEVAAGGSGDTTIAIRLLLYEAGWQAFLQSPLIGHGWANMMGTAETFLAEDDKVHALLPHLHNEVLNFAVFAGVIGVALYAALMAAPIVIALRSARDSQYEARLGGAIVVVIAYLVMGLTDTMVSFELHTALYVGWMAMLLSWCRDTRTTGS